jgi:hypothetical protein
MSEAIVIDRGCSGPPGTGNGGYVAGLLAARLGSGADVSFRRPVPLGRELQIDRDDDAVRLHDVGELLAEARPASLHIVVPPPPSLEEARDAATRFIGRRVRLPFAACLGCGIERAEGDGLRIFAGPLSRGEAYAAPWTPHPNHSDERGDVRPEYVWTALDCSGGFAITGEEQRTVLTARLAARIDVLPRAGEPLVVSAWVIERGERKHVTGTALFTVEGRLLAVGRALWVEPRGG